MSPVLNALLQLQPLSRVRRNHGLEHATLHILAKRFPQRNMAGHSDTGGFWLLGDIPTEAVESAVLEALHRMKNGEHGLAVHPNCGTNFVTSGSMAGMAGAFAMWGAGPEWRDKAERLSLAALLATIALIFSRPLGFWLQAHVTTSGHPQELEIVEIRRTTRGGVPAHRVVTRN
ncbi:MAG: hypothetical protein D6755_12165 [Anaerolineae bacterium]|nr:MAG: hypothetical protein D6755_12165 [Anaerolineae bacterium]